MSKSAPRLIKIDQNLAHDQWGHNNRKREIVYANLLRYELIGDKVKCDARRIAKAKRANVSKTTSVKTTKPGEHVYVNTSGCPFEGAPAHRLVKEDHYSDKLHDANFPCQETHDSVCGSGLYCFVQG